MSMNKRHYNVGKDNPSYGKHYHWKLSVETKEKMRLSKIGNKNPNWKGDNIKMIALHHYVRYHLPQPKKCQICKKSLSYDLANITGIYTRDLKNWKYICRRCHMLSDGRMMNNLKQFSKGNKKK